MPPLPASVANNGWVTKLPDSDELRRGPTQEVFARVRANELRQARAVRAAKEYHKQLVNKSSGK